MGYNTKNGGREEKPFELLDTDVYRMEIKKAEIAPNTYAEPNEDGTYPDQLLIVWEVYQAGPEQDDGVVGRAVFQRMAPWYGTGKRGDSQFKMLVDSLNEQVDAGLLEFGGIDPEDFDPAALVGLRQRVSVENYKKTMGKNQGQPGNRVVGAPKSLKKPQAKTAPPAAPKPRAGREVFADETY